MSPATSATLEALPVVDYVQRDRSVKASAQTLPTGGGYATISGTSQASPHVAGAAALWESGPTSTRAQAKSALQSAGSLGWNDADDPDPTKERLLNVSGL